jgi:two-component system sensor histidine kinase ChiS
LAAEIAISIVNARLYSGLKETLDHVSRLNDAYRRFIPHEMLTLLAKKSVVDLHLGDYVQREMSVLFADIRSFTSMSEAMTPRETFEFVNRYLEMMGPLIRKNGGYIDKYIGDAIMALFPEAPDDALAAAVAMQLRLRELNLARERDGQAPIAIRIGVHVGSVILGTVGEHERMEGTVISDTVNLAVRLEGLCQRFGAGVIVSGEVLARSKDRDRYPRRFLGSIKVKGKERPVDAFEIFAVDLPELVTRKSATKEEFERGVQCLAQDDVTAAIVHFRNVLRDSPDDPATLYLVSQAAERLHKNAGPLI